VADAQMTLAVAKKAFSAFIWNFSPTLYKAEIPANTKNPLTYKPKPSF
jgi:hypothetical protein